MTVMPQRCFFNIFSGLSENLRPVAKGSGERLFQGPRDATEMGSLFWDIGQEGQMGHRARSGNTCGAPRPPQEQLPHLACTEVTMAGQQTPPERLCNDRNNSGYSLPDEKKLRIDRTGKRPVSLQACPNQNENKHLLTVQHGMLSCRAQAAPPLAPNLGLFCRSLCLP